MTAFSNDRTDPRNGSVSWREMDPELHEILEFDELPGKYGIRLQDFPNPNTLRIFHTEDTGGVLTGETGFIFEFEQVSVAPQAGQFQVPSGEGVKSGLIFFNSSDVNKTVQVGDDGGYEGGGTVATIDTINSFIGSAPGVTTTKGDIAVNNGSVLERFPVGSDGSIIVDKASTTLGRTSVAPGADYTVLSSRAGAANKVEYSTLASLITNANPLSIVAKELFYPLNRTVQGMLPSINSGDTSNDWDVSPGWCWDATFTKVIYLSASVTKKLDASWAVGTNQGGLDTGAKASNTTYFVWVILRSDTGVVDVLFSTSSSAPTMPANYDYKRLIGVFKTDGSSNNRQVLTEIWGDQVKYRMVTLVNDVTTSTLGTSRATQTLASCPSAAGITAVLNCNCSKSSTAVFIAVTALDETDITPTAALNTLRGGSGADGVASTEVQVKLNSSAQFGARADSTNVGFNANLKAYFYSRTI